MTIASTILGSGRFLPGAPVSNGALARVMDTSDAWIEKRTGIRQRHYAPDGVGASDLAVHAARRALEHAGVALSAVDYVLFNTMTPDSILPGPAALFTHKLGLTGVPALDLRQQCAAIPFSLGLADALIRAGAARYVLIACAETHASLMPWTRWDLLDADAATVDQPRDEEDYRRATEHRGVSVLFGDGAGAFVVGPTDRPGAGLLASEVHSDGRGYEALRIDEHGFRFRGLRGRVQSELDFVPRMHGTELFKAAVQRLPEVVESVCKKRGVRLDNVDFFLAHQANDRINRAVRDSLGIAPAKVPSNIARYGNTSSATLPILTDELFEAGTLARGQLVCFFALGAGLHWGAALMRL